MITASDDLVPPSATTASATFRYTFRGPLAAAQAHLRSALERERSLDVRHRNCNLVGALLAAVAGAAAVAPVHGTWQIVLPWLATVAAGGAGWALWLGRRLRNRPRPLSGSRIAAVVGLLDGMAPDIPAAAVLRIDFDPRHQAATDPGEPWLSLHGALTGAERFHLRVVEAAGATESVRLFLELRPTVEARSLVARLETAPPPDPFRLEGALAHQGTVRVVLAASSAVPADRVARALSWVLDPVNAGS